MTRSEVTGPEVRHDTRSNISSDIEDDIPLLEAEGNRERVPAEVGEGSFPVYGFEPVVANCF